MSYEALWYSGYSRDGKQPYCARWSRLPMDEQYALTIDLAIAYAEGRAGYRNFASVAATGERYWYWQHPRTDAGWWMVPPRIHSRVVDLLDQAARSCGGAPTNLDVARMLARWKSAGSWRRRIAHIAPRRPAQAQRRKSGSR